MIYTTTIPGYPETPVADVFSDSIELDNLRFISLRWLRKLKQTAGRHKGLDDLEHLPLRSAPGYSHGAAYAAGIVRRAELLCLGSSEPLKESRVKARM